MKRSFLLVLVTLFMFSILSGCSDSTSKTPISSDVYVNDTDADVNTDIADNSLYKPIVEEIISAQQSKGFALSYGTIYDVDSNGVDELIMMYDKDNVSLQGGESYGSCMVYSVYTLKDGEVENLINEEMLYVLAGGPQGEVSVLNDNGQTLLGFKYSEIDPLNNTLYTEGKWDIYSLNDADIKNEKEVEYGYESSSDLSTIIYSNSEVTINGSSDKYENFEKWLNGCNPQVILSTTDESLTLENLLPKL
ncbi:MAG: hypothetical protein IKB73_03250 [Ruminococcus sp.]|nr:hypothetical protein [Ruminococcus sp.]